MLWGRQKFRKTFLWPKILSRSDIMTLCSNYQHTNEKVVPPPHIRTFWKPRLYMIITRLLYYPSWMSMVYNGTWFLKIFKRIGKNSKNSSLRILRLLQNGIIIMRKHSHVLILPFDRTLRFVLFCFWNMRWKTSSTSDWFWPREK